MLLPLLPVCAKKLLITMSVACAAATRSSVSFQRRLPAAAKLPRLPQVCALARRRFTSATTEAWKAVMLQLLAAVSALLVGVPLLVGVAVPEGRTVLGVHWAGASSPPPLQALSSPISRVAPNKRAKLQMRWMEWLFLWVMSGGLFA